MPQLMPVGELVILPLPVLLALSLYVLSVKLAVTDLGAVMFTTQVPEPEQPSPFQPLKVEPVEAVEVSDMDVPER